MSFNATFAFCHLFGCETAGIPPLRNDDILVIAAGSTDFDFVEVAYSAQVPSMRLDQLRPMEAIIFKTSVRTSAG